MRLALFTVGVCGMIVAIAIGAVAQQPAQELAEPLKLFAPYIGKTWKGILNDDSGAVSAPMYDVARWERALNGNAIRIVHSVGDGVYGGESIIFWDPEKKVLGSWYFTTAGFRTEGTMKLEDGKWIGQDKVIGEGSGITEVKSVTEFLPDGRMHTKARFLKNGQWEPGHEITYKEAPEAQVVFK